MPLVLESCVALKAAHRRDAQPRNQVRIFAVGLFDAAPARLARHIHHRGQRLVRAAQARFQRGHREKLLHQLGIERRAQGRWAAESWFHPAPRGRAGTPRERSPECPAGCSRGKTSGWRWSARPCRARPCRRRHRSDGRPGPVRGRRETTSSPSGESKLPSASTSVSAFCLPDAHHLRGLFLQRHARQQVLHAPGGGQTGVFIGGSSFAGGHGDCGLLLFHAIHSSRFLSRQGTAIGRIREGLTRGAGSR